ncbi:membrane protein [Nitzschia inconspicua]|uniref:Membrane protein n=1 Tax=Nitzschia inconspicua TaxID=303405 RepID=A0A9K3KNR9_9STRA|nr:membrane protein [Nitzschia inconspicua]
MVKSKSAFRALGDGRNDNQNNVFVKSRQQLGSTSTGVERNRHENVGALHSWKASKRIGSLSFVLMIMTASTILASWSGSDRRTSVRNLRAHPTTNIMPWSLWDRSLQEIADDGNSSSSLNMTDICSLDYCLDSYQEELCPTEIDNDWIAAVPLAFQILLTALLLSMSALFSGLTLGLMSLDLTGLEIVMAGDDPQQAQNAKNIYPVRKQGNLLLCTLLLGNVAVNSLLSIIMAAFTGGTIGFVTSTIMIVVFGEILPQALCSRYPLQIGSTTLPIVKVIRVLLYPFAYPLAKCLDWILGRELASTYSNAEMMHLLKIHVQENIIDQEAANAMTGALTYKNVPVKDAMTPIDRTFMLGVDEKLSFETIGIIFKTGYSRIPIYEISKSNVVGILLVKDLIFIDPEDEIPIRSFIQIFGRSVHAVWPDDTLGEVLAELKKGRSHLAVVRDVNNKDAAQDPFYEAKGIITLEDIVERILGDSIVDETDAYADSFQSIKVERGESFEWARLRLLDTKIVDELLSPSEISAVTAHLKTNFADSFKLISDSQLTRLVSSTPVSTFPTATQEVGSKLPNELLYEKGVANDAFTLILSGKVTIFVGAENFRADLSSWSVLGKASLETKSWVPDFTAYVSDGPCRCIQIHYDAFAEAVDASVAERRAGENKAYSYTQVQASNSIDEDGGSVGDSATSPADVHNRRGPILEKLFNVGKSKDTSGETDRLIVTSSVHFASSDTVIPSSANGKG